MNDQKPVAWLFKANRHDGTTSESVAFTAALASLGHTKEDGYVSWWTVPLFCAPRWIPVEEQLPGRNVNVLVYIPVSEEKTFIASLDEGGMWFSSDPTADAYSLGEYGAPTHWMPLPAPPADDK